MRRRRLREPRLPRPVTDEHLAWARDVVEEHLLGACEECRRYGCARLGDARMLMTVRRTRWESTGHYRRGMPPERLDLVKALRTKGMTWVEVAAAVRDRWNLTALVAMRLAHGWSQRDAADEWCRRWPDSPKTFKNFSYWENWPNPTGYAPSLAVLQRLAELYQCAVADLLNGVGDFRHLDESRDTTPALFGYCPLCASLVWAPDYCGIPAGGGGRPLP